MAERPERPPLAPAARSEAVLGDASRSGTSSRAASRSGAWSPAPATPACDESLAGSVVPRSESPGRCTPLSTSDAESDAPPPAPQRPPAAFKFGQRARSIANDGPSTAPPGEHAALLARAHATIAQLTAELDRTRAERDAARLELACISADARLAGQGPHRGTHQDPTCSAPAASDAAWRAALRALADGGVANLPDALAQLRVGDAASPPAAPPAQRSPFSPGARTGTPPSNPFRLAAAAPRRDA